MQLTLKAINDELAKRRVGARLEKGDGYFYSSGGEASDWLDKTVNAPSLSSLSLEQWIAEFERLTKLNDEILKASAREGPAEVPSPPAKQRHKKR